MMEFRKVSFEIGDPTFDQFLTYVLKLTTCPKRTYF